jgi:lipoprotein-anchoring transpeptidase ErfK/SrfK
MQRICVSALLASALCVPAWADPLRITPDAYTPSHGWNAGAAAAPEAVEPSPEDRGGQRYAQVAQPNFGGGFIEFLFGGAARQPAVPRAYQPERPDYQQYPQPSVMRGEPDAGYAPASLGDGSHPPVDPKFDRQIVAYDGKEQPGTIVIDTPHKFLYLVQEGGKAMRYGIGVGKPGFTWSGVKTITAKREWPDWRPPDEMIARRPDLPRYMAGGPENPLGARAMYLGSTLYRIHGSNEPWTIGANVSSGCIRLRNADVIDLYGRVQVGTKVIVL